MILCDILGSFGLCPGDKTDCKDPHHIDIAGCIDKQILKVFARHLVKNLYNSTAFW